MDTGSEIDTKVISFPQEESWNPRNKVVEFPVKIDDETIRCEVTFGALRDNFGASLSNALLTFQIHRKFIEARAEVAILNGWFERDGSVRLTTKDCL